MQGTAGGVLVLAALSVYAVVSVQATFGFGKSDNGVEQFADLVAALEDETKDIQEDLSDIRSLASAGDARQWRIQETLLPALDIINSQQDGLAATYKGQLQGLLSRVGEARAGVAGATALAAETKKVITTATSIFNSTVLAPIAQQGVLISNLEQKLIDSVAEAKQNTQDAVGALSDLLAARKNTINNLADFVDSRTCQYGRGSLRSSNLKVAFNPPFPTEPTVTLTITGFQGRVDDTKKKLGVNKLGPDVFTEDVSANGFTIVFDDASEGTLSVGRVHYSFTACSNLDAQFAPN